LGNTTEITASPKLRATFAVAAAIMFALWGWSLVPPIENWGNPNEDGFSYVALFYTTITCLPVGFFLLIGAISGRGRRVTRARFAFFIAVAITLLVVAFLIVQHIANNNDGKVFGIQIGFQLDREDSRPADRRGLV
jgi:Na+-driven multidrug efflux pump